MDNRAMTSLTDDRGGFVRAVGYTSDPEHLTRRGTDNPHQVIAFKFAFDRRHTNREN